MMTRLRVASLFVAVVAGDYALLVLINGRLIDFGVTAGICAGSLAAAGLIAYASRRRRQAVARGRAAVWERRDQQAGDTTSPRPLSAQTPREIGWGRRATDEPGAEALT